MRKNLQINDDDQFLRLIIAFERIRRLVATKAPELAHINLNAFCPEAERDYKRSPRQFMHANHCPNAICTWAPAAVTLDEGFLFGLFLHEFGHLAPRMREEKADQWSFEKLGVAIEYKSPLKIEWVSPRKVPV